VSPPTIGPYRVIRQLGKGGMGVVYEAVHDAIERRVAIKVLHPEYAKDRETAARFFNEARAVNRIEHPSLVQISDYGHTGEGTAYLIMEFLRGESLADRLDRLRAAGQRLAVTEVVRITWQIADALRAAHAKQIVHRDLKPGNLMLVRDPIAPGGERVKVLDFGIAKLMENGTRRTSTGAVMGTPLYMSPEQCRGAGEVDERSDVYSLGAMLYESHPLPFSVENLTA
jgi:serine/threonine protein kinase